MSSSEVESLESESANHVL